MDCFQRGSEKTVLDVGGPQGFTLATFAPVDAPEPYKINRLVLDALKFPRETEEQRAVKAGLEELRRQKAYGRRLDDARLDHVSNLCAVYHFNRTLGIVEFRI